MTGNIQFFPIYKKIRLVLCDNNVVIMKYGQTRNDDLVIAGWKLGNYKWWKHIDAIKRDVKICSEMLKNKTFVLYVKHEREIVRTLAVHMLDNADFYLNEY